MEATPDSDRQVGTAPHQDEATAQALAARILAPEDLEVARPAAQPAALAMRGAPANAEPSERASEQPAGASMFGALKKLVPEHRRKSSVDMDDGERERAVNGPIQRGAGLVILAALTRLVIGVDDAALEMLLIGQACVLALLVLMASKTCIVRRQPLATSALLVAAAGAFCLQELTLTGNHLWICALATLAPLATALFLTWPLANQFVIVGLSAAGIAGAFAIEPAGFSGFAAIVPSFAMMAALGSLLITHTREGIRFRRDSSTEARLQRQIVLREIQAELEGTALAASSNGLVSAEASGALEQQHLLLAEAQQDAQAELDRLKAELAQAIDRAADEQARREHTEKACADYEQKLRAARSATAGLQPQKEQQVAQAAAYLRELESVRRTEAEFDRNAGELAEIRKTAEARVNELMNKLDEANERATRAARKAVEFHNAARTHEENQAATAERLEREQRRYEHTIKELRESLASDAGSAKDLSSELRDAEERLEQSEATVAALTATLEAQTERMQRIESRAAELTEIRAALEHRIAHSETELTKERAHSSEIGRAASAERAESATRIAKLEADLAAARAERDSLEAELREVRAQFADAEQDMEVQLAEARRAAAAEASRRRNAEAKLAEAQAGSDTATVELQEALRGELRQTRGALEREVRQREAAVGTLRLHQNQLRERHNWIGRTAEEVRPLLAGIRADLSALLNDEIDEMRRIRLLGICHDVTRATRTINDMLDIEMVSSLGRRVTTASAAVNQAIDEILPLMAADEAGPVWRVDLAPEINDVRIDQAHLFQLLGNLVEHAAEIAPPYAPLTVEAWEGSSEVLVEISGPDLESAATGDTVFDGCSDSEMGTRLAPVLIRTLAESFGGRVWSESREGRGSLCLALPTAARTAQFRPVVVGESIAS